MSFEFEQAETVDNSGGFIDKPGKYHFLITEMDAAPINKKTEQPVDGLEMTLEVLDGTDKTQIGKSKSITLYKPKLDSKDKGNMAKKKLTRLLVALGGTFEPNQKASIDPATSVGRQIVAEFTPNVGTDGKTYMDLAYAEIYHVDDPAVAAVPKSADALKLIPAELRKKFDPPATATPVAPNPAGSPGGTGASSPVSLDEI